MIMIKLKKWMSKKIQTWLLAKHHVLELAIAIAALTENDGDLVNAFMSLTV